jgi:hypothetical protein
MKPETISSRGVCTELLPYSCCTIRSLPSFHCRERRVLKRHVIVVFELGSLDADGVMAELLATLWNSLSLITAWKRSQVPVT